ncbi:MAG TPA: hypothetical protein DCS87_09115 [Rheinheimera sp.]|nr:hypothetical protein [Rheinheimera sp.]
MASAQQMSSSSSPFGLLVGNQNSVGHLPRAAQAELLAFSSHSLSELRNASPLAVTAGADLLNL